MNDKILHIVHTIDTEGPLDEDLLATFERIKDTDILTDPIWTVASRGQERVSLVE